MFRSRGPRSPKPPRDAEPAEGGLIPDEADTEPDRDPEQEIEQSALRLLTQRDHSRAELRRKLTGRGGEPELIGRVLDRLAEERLQDDGRFVDEYIASRRRRGFGPLRIRAELRERGVAPDEIAPRLDLPDADWLDELRAAAVRKFGATYPADPKERARRARFLEYRGYPPELIRRFLKE